jgi:hypothetical protein
MTTRPIPVNSMRVRLTRKLAERVDGVDLSSYREGDVLALPSHEAELLVAEGWAVAAETPRAVNRRRLQHLQHAVEYSRFAPHAHRRAEDRVRDELHDALARIVNPPAAHAADQVRRTRTSRRSSR